jgi:hypothetical protein
MVLPSCVAASVTPLELPLPLSNESPPLFLLLLLTPIVGNDVAAVGFMTGLLAAADKLPDSSSSSSSSSS